MKEQFVKKPGYLFAKRCFDVFCSLLAIILLSPVFLILMAIVKFTSEGPVFYSHKRIGKDGKEIGILKFRSMVVNAEEMIKNFTPNRKKSLKRILSLKMTLVLPRLVNFYVNQVLMNCHSFSTFWQARFLLLVLDQLHIKKHLCMERIEIYF